MQYIYTQRLYLVYLHSYIVLKHEIFRVIWLLMHITASDMISHREMVMVR